MGNKRNVEICITLASMRNHSDNMMTSFPSINFNESSVTITFFPLGTDGTTRFIDFVLDFDQFGQLIGIEIINLKFYCGEVRLKLIEQSIEKNAGKLRYTYDVECDAFYLRLNEGTSTNQKAVEGTVNLNGNEIVSLSAGW